MATKRTSKKTSVGRKRSKKTKNLASDYAGYFRTKQSIRFLTRVYDEAYKWKPKLSIIAPGKRPDEALKILQKRLKELRLLEKRYKKSGLLNKIHRMRCTKGKPFPPYGSAHLSSTGKSLKRRGDVELEKDIIKVVPYTEPNLNAGLPENLQDILDRLGPREQEETFFAGKVLSSDHRECEWAPMSISGSEGQINFEPSIAGSFINSAEMRFWANLEAPSGCFVDPVEFLAKSSIFQFTLPAAPWDAYVQWQVYAFYYLQGLKIDADYAWLSIETWARQDPAGGNFPTCSDNYPANFAHDIAVSTADENLYLEDWIYNFSDFRSHFPIQRGKRSRIYIGCSVGLWVENGSLDLAHGNASFCASYNQSDLGLQYIMHRLD